MAGGALKSASMDDLDLRMSEGVRPLYDAVCAFIQDEVDPITEEFHRLGEGRADRWSWAPGQLELLEGAKAKARSQGLWNFFLPNAETGEGLSNLDYAYIANELGKNRLASECLNCSAPDTGNMEVLERVGTPHIKIRLSIALPHNHGQFRNGNQCQRVHPVNDLPGNTTCLSFLSH